MIVLAVNTILVNCDEPSSYLEYQVSIRYTSSRKVLDRCLEGSSRYKVEVHQGTIGTRYWLHVGMR